MSVEMRRRVEKVIVRSFIIAALADGYTINIYDEDDDEDGLLFLEPCNDLRKIMDAMFACDMERLHLFKDGKRHGWILFVYGNDGWDVICDYTTNLEHLMAEPNKLSEKYAA